MVRIPMTIAYILSFVLLLASVSPLEAFGRSNELAGRNNHDQIHLTIRETLIESATESPTDSAYYPMDNVHVLAVRPGGKELYAYSYDPSNMILIVDVGSPNYPVIGRIQLPPAKKVCHTYISFSHDGKHAYLNRLIDCQFEEHCSQPKQIIVIDAEKKEVEAAIPIPYNPMEVVVPSLDDKYLYFIGLDFDAVHFGIAKLDLEKQEVGAFFPLEGVNFITMSRDGERIYATQGCNFFGAPPGSECTPQNLFTVIDAQSFEIIATAPTGDGPRYIAVTPDGEKAYIANQWSSDTTVVDLKTMAVKATINIGADRSAIAITPNGKKAYITLPGSGAAFQFQNSVAVVDVEKDLVVGVIRVHLEPLTIAINPDGTRAYVPDGNANGANPSEIHVLDIINDVYLKPIILRPAAYYMPTGIDITPDGKTLFIVSEGGAENQRSTTRLLVVDTETHTFLSLSDFQPRGVKVSKDGTKVYIFCPQLFLALDRTSLQVIKSIDLTAIFPDFDPNAYFDQSEFTIALDGKEETAYLFGRSNEIIVVDLAKDAVVEKIPFAEKPLEIEHGLALTPDGSLLFVSDYHSQTVAVIDTASRTVTTRLPLEARPTAIRISQDGKRVYVVEGSSVTMMTVFDTATYAVLKKYMLSVSAPRGFTLSADERFAFITDFDPNILIVYDLQEERVLKVVETGLDPFSMVSSPDMRFLYITNFTSDAISVFDTQTNQMLHSIVFPPPAPNPSSPLNGLNNAPTNPVFSWTYSGETVGFGLQVSTKEDFSTIEVYRYGIFNTSYAIHRLRGNTTYYWRVNATSAGGTSEWSPINNFRTALSRSIPRPRRPRGLAGRNGISMQTKYSVLSVASGDSSYGISGSNSRKNGVTISEAVVPALTPKAWKSIIYRNEVDALNRQSCSRPFDKSGHSHCKHK
jgi:YVTN family beta-propeller protein